MSIVCSVNVCRYGSQYPSYNLAEREVKQACRSELYSLSDTTPAPVFYICFTVLIIPSLCRHTMR